MSMARISGLASGLDTDKIISQLMEIEKRPLLKLEQTKANYTAQQLSLQDINSKLLALKNAAADLTLPSLFQRLSVSSSDSKSVVGYANASATPGTWTVNSVTRLATATTAKTVGTVGKIVDPDTPLENMGSRIAVTNGTFTINNVVFTISDVSTQTLNDIINDINSRSAETGVIASYDITTGKFTLSNANPGDKTRISVASSSDTSSFLSAMYVAGAYQDTSSGTTRITSTSHIGAMSRTDLLSSSRFNQPITEGNIKINGVSIAVSHTDTIQTLMNKINNSSANVTARFNEVTDRVEIISKSLGANAIKFESDGSNALEVLGLTDPAAQTLGQDAEYMLDGVTMYSNSNTISSVISGVTLELKATTNSPVTITVAADTSQATEKVKAFVNAYNSAIKAMVDATKEGGALEADGTIRSLLFQLKSRIFGVPSGLPSGSKYRSLAEIGISTGAVGMTMNESYIGTLEFDAAKFADALSTNSSDVMNLFAYDSNSDRKVDTGVAHIFNTMLKSITEPGGIMDKRDQSISKAIERTEDEIARFNRELAAIEAAYYDKYTALERALAGLQRQGTWLMNQLGALSSYSSGSSGKK